MVIDFDFIYLFKIYQKSGVGFVVNRNLSRTEKVYIVLEQYSH